MSLSLGNGGFSRSAADRWAVASQGLVSSNFSPANMARWNLAKARVRANTQDAVIIFAGDSTTVGHGAGDIPISNWTNAQPRSMPSRVAAMLATLGLPSTANPFAGPNLLNSSNATLAVLPLYKPTIAVASSGTTDWYGANILTLGGFIMNNNSGTGAFSLIEANAFDAIDICYLQAGGNGTFTVDIGGAALATINAGSPATGAIVKATVSTGAAAAAGTINIKRASGTQIRPIAVIARNTGVKRVQVLNAGIEGARTGDWAGNVASAAYNTTSTAFYGPANVISTIDPDLTVIKLGANDLANSISVAQAQANLTVLITAAKLNGGSCVLVIPTPMDPATRDPLGNTASYNSMVRALALSQGCGLIDLFARYQSWAIANAQGYFADNVHGTLVEYANEGDLIGRILSGA